MVIQWTGNVTINHSKKRKNLYISLYLIYKIMEYNKSVKDGLRDQIDIIIRANNILFEYFTLVRCDINVFFL